MLDYSIFIKLGATLHHHNELVPPGIAVPHLHCFRNGFTHMTPGTLVQIVLEKSGFQFISKFFNKLPEALIH